MNREIVEISLRYSGQDVDDGSMAVSDIVPVLQGFSGAYSKISGMEDTAASHKIRIVGVRSGSADIVLEVWRFFGDNVDQLTGAGVVATGATAAVGGVVYAIRKIAGVLAAKRHIKKLPYTERIDQAIPNSIIVTNSENVSISVTLEVYELMKNGTIDADLGKIVSPLSEGRIESAQLQARSHGIVVLDEIVTVEEKPYFDTGQVSVSTTSETWLVVRLNSLTKSTNSGYLYLTDGTRVFYKYLPDDQKLRQAFLFDDPVRIRCIAHVDESLRPNLIEISDVEVIQAHLFPHDSQITGESCI